MRDAWRWIGLLLLLVLLAACGAGDATPTDEPSEAPTPDVALPRAFEESFEDGLGAWQTGADVPEDPNNPGQPVAWQIELSGEEAASGEQAVRLQLDGSQDDGTIWLARSFPVPPDTDLSVRFSLWLWSASESFNTLANVAAYAGNEPPVAEEQFDTTLAANQVEGWQQYEYEFVVTSDGDGRVWIATGISVVWETEVVYFLDGVEGLIQEAPEGTPGARPPAGWLIVGDARQESGVGTYCWGDPESGEGVSVCADAIGIITPVDALPVPATFTAQFQLQVDDPASVVLNVLPVDSEDEIVTGPAAGRDWRAWRPGEGQHLELEPSTDPQIDLALDPGTYVLSMFARWDAYGDVNYGWLVAVEGAGQAEIEPASGLVVEEVAIVDDSQDQPSHLEYLDRIDPAILARREAWRGYDTELRISQANEALQPFGYRLEPFFDEEWGRTFYDLYSADQEEPVLPGLSYVWMPSVSEGGDQFVMAVENAPNSGHPYLLVTEDWIDDWQADSNAFLPPVYAGSEMVSVQVTPAVNLTYDVVRGGEVVYTGQATMTVDMPVDSLSGWDDHWALEVNDTVIIDGEDLGAREGSDAVFGFEVLGGEPFYFYRQADTVYMSYAGETLPETYDEVVHNQCCEPSMFNVQANEMMVWFHALRDGVWYYVEAGLFGEELGGVPPLAEGGRYVSPEGWSIQVPAGWDVVNDEVGFIQDSDTGKTITFDSEVMTGEQFERWMETEVARKLAATEAENTLAEPVSVEVVDGVSVLRYAILSRMEGQETLLRTTVFYDGERRYAFYAAMPPVTEEEYLALLDSFVAVP